MNTEIKTINPPWCHSVSFSSKSEQFNHYHDNKVTAVFGIVVKNNQILIVYNPSKKKWCLPGGHVNKDEHVMNDFHKTLERELKEEAQLEDVKGEIFCNAEVHNSIKKFNSELKEDYPYPYSYLKFFEVLNFKETNKRIISEISKKEWMDFKDALYLLGISDKTVLKFYLNQKKITID